MNLSIIGATAVDFTSDDGVSYDYIKIIALVDNKRGVGSICQAFKYDKPSQHLKDEFAFIKANQVYQTQCQGVFESNGKTANFVIKQVQLLDKDKDDK
ncbi:hypothetical protein B0181_11455 [Moraxella caviae]|nr:hypothetical protein B0181_11455 [Moraxella caviae]